MVLEDWKMQIFQQHFLNPLLGIDCSGEKSEVRGTSELRGPIGGSLIELWSFLLSSHIDLLLKQLV